ncbi:MAG TPA: hypothetical protein VFT79_09165 [Solirubrobacterales bacterium]|nr:hypothetical protein [Solirubrobacterales bacterium]
MADQKPPPQILGDLSQDMFNDLSGGVVRHSHAEDAMLKPDSFVTLEFQDAPRLSLATKRIQVPNGDFVLLAIGSEFKGNHVLQSGYRLYGDGEELAELADNPEPAFRVLLERYGNRYEVAGREVLFVPILTVEFVESVERTIEITLNLDLSAESEWAANVIASQAGGEVKMLWPFAIDMARYKADARSYGWQS